MRQLILMLVLASVALSSPQSNAVAGSLSASQPQSIGIEGAYFRGDARLEAVTDLRDSRQFRLILKLKNVSKTKAYWAIHVCLLDASNNLVGACSYNQGSGENPGKAIEHQADVFMPDVQAVKRYQLVFYEDSKPIGAR